MLVDENGENWEAVFLTLYLSLLAVGSAKDQRYMRCRALKDTAVTLLTVS